MAKKKYNPADEQGKLLKESQAIGKALGMEFGDIADIQEQILNKQIKSNQALLDALKLAKQTAEANKIRFRQEDEIYQKQVDKLKLQKEEKQLIADRIKQSNQLQDLTDDLAKSIQGSQKTLLSNTEDTYNAQKKLIKARKQEIAESRKNGEINSSVARSLYDQLNALDDQVDKIQQVQNTYQKQFETMTALGGFLKKNFGEVGEILDGSISKGLEAFSEEMGKSGDAAQSQQAAMKAFGGQLSSSLLKMFSLVGVATLLYTTLSDALKQIKEFSKETGTSVGQSQELVNSAKLYAATSGLSLATAEKTLDVQKQLVAEFGNVNTISTQTAAELAQIGESFGYGAVEAGKVQSAMMSIGASAEDALKIQGFSAAMAEAAGVAPGAVMKDIAQNAKTTAKYFAGNPKALAKAAVEAARMGMSLQDMASVADKLLDIESSLTAQFEASAMLGRTINMDKARQLALDGDIEGATKATLEQVGSIADFEKMSMLQRKKIAQAAGMEVSQIEKALQLQEKTQGMSAEQLATVNKYGDALGDISKMNKQDLLDKTKALQATEQLDAVITQIKDVFTTALLPAAKVFGVLLTAVLWPIQTALGMIDSMVAMFTGGYDALSGWGKTLAVIGTILTTVFLPTIIAGAYGMLANAVSSIYTGLSMIPFGLGIPLAVGAAAGLVSQFTGLMGNVKKTGDLSIDANGGPVVMSPRENTIFQGTKNDDVAMYPGATTGGGSTDMTETNSLLRQLLSAMKTPVPVVIGDKAVNEIGKQYATNSSYKPAGSR